MGYTKNSIIINENIDTVFEITNDIANWKNLFSEYQDSDVLEQTGNKIKFRLTMFPDEKGVQRSWVSERTINKENYTCEAVRLDPKHPFEYMNIYWEYKSLGRSTEMTWIQKFKPANNVEWDDLKFENYLNKNTKIQMEVIKSKIEKRKY